MADGNIIVRPAIADDARALADNVAALQAENLRTISRRRPRSEDEERALIAKADANDRALLLVAPEGDKVVGMLDIWARTGQGDWHVARLGFSVAQNWRGRASAAC